MKNNNINLISHWTATITLGLVLASYIWTVSFKFASFEARLTNVETKLDDLIETVKAMKETMDKTFPVIELRLTDAERRLDKLEPKVERLEKK